MSNKTQLQTNNTNLQTVLSNVLGLPTEESCKTGAYVWKKCKSKSPIGIASLSASGTSTVITLESSEGVTEETLDGAVFTATMIDGTYSCTFTLSYANGSKTFSSTDVYGGNYSYSNGVITLNTTFAFTSSQFNASDITFPDVEPEFIGFVVSDIESAYPDGGMQGGYWYEKVVEGIIGIDMGKITPTADSTSFTIPTTLTTLPSAFLLFNNTGNNVAGGKVAAMFVTEKCWNGSSYTIYGMQSTSGNLDTFKSKLSNKITYSNGELTVNILSTALSQKLTNIEYTWIALS